MTAFQIVIEIATDAPGVSRYVLPNLYETHQLARYLADREVQVNCADGAYVRQVGDVSAYYTEAEYAAMTADLIDDMPFRSPSPHCWSLL